MKRLTLDVRRLALGLVLLFAVASGARAQDSAAVRRRWLFLPGIGWTQETGVEVGFTVMTIATPRRDSVTRPTTTSTYIVRSQKGQTRGAIEMDRWLPDNRRRVQAALNAVEYPFSFFGIGDNTTAAQEERYVPRWLEGYVQVDERVRPHLYAIAGVRAGYQEVTPKSPGLLQSELVPGSRVSRTMILTAGATYDTRDNVVSARRGQRASLAYGHSAPALGASYSYGRLDADWRGFRELSGHHVIAASASVVGVDGTVPFDQYAVIGGSRIMRGYPAGRFRDRWVSAVQGEYRSPLWLERLGAVAFAGVGAAAPRPGLLTDARAFPSAGVGARLQTDKVQRTGLRVDYAFAAYGFGSLYVGFNQAF